MRTSCSAGRPAGLKLFALTSTQTKAGRYYSNWKIEGIVFVLFPMRGSMAGAVTEAPGVLSEYSPRLKVFESLRSIIGLVCYL